MADEIIEIADDETIEPNGRRVRVDTRKWLMSKLAPQRYGERLVHSGDPENPIQVMHRRAGIVGMEPHELTALAQLAAALEPSVTDDDVVAADVENDLIAAKRVTSRRSTMPQLARSATGRCS